MSEADEYTPPISAPSLGAGEIDGNYHQWCQARDHQIPFRYSIRRHPRLLFSVIVPVHNPLQVWLQECVDSVRSQFFADWELILVDDASDQIIVDLLTKIQSLDQRIKVKLQPQQVGISCSTNAGVDIASGEYLVFLDHDDILDPYALTAFAHRIQLKPESMVLYADEDRFNDQYLRLQPGFKPGFSLEKLLCTNYIHHPVVMQRTLFVEIGGLDKQFDGSQDYDLLLRAVEKTTAIEHIPDVLYHMRLHSGSLSSSAAAKPEAHSKGEAAVLDYLNRQNSSAIIKSTYYSGFHNLSYPIIKRPAISILLLHNEETSKATTKLNWQLHNKDEILICNDQSQSIPIRLNNLAVKANSEIIIFADAQLIPDPQCLDQLIGQCIRKKIGLVTGKLSYSDAVLHSCGLVLGIRACAGRWHYACHSEDLGYGGWMTITHEVSAVPWQLMAVKKELFLQAGLFDSQYIKHGFEVHLALKLSNEFSVNHLAVANAKAHYPYPCPQNPDNWKEQDFFRLWEHWQHTLNQDDPYFNPNFSVFDESITFSNLSEQHLKRFGLFKAYDKLTFKMLQQCFRLDNTA